MTDIDHEGLVAKQPGQIITWTGKRVNPMYLTPDDIDIVDIAHALARQCRYNGHTHGHLSVARHSLWVAGQLVRSGHPELELWGLLHDATEAYIGDMVKPLKIAPEMEAFRRAEDNAEVVICRAFNLVWPMPAEVHEADRAVTVDLEIGQNLRGTWDSHYDADERDFLHVFDSLNGRYMR